MECFNGKKMPVLRASAFLWESVIMQEQVRLGLDSVYMCLRAITTAYECASGVRTVHSFMHEVCNYAFLLESVLTASLTRSPIHTVTLIYTSAQYAYVLIMLQCCRW